MLSQPRKASHPNRIKQIKEVENIMKKIIVGFAGLVIILLPSEIAFAFGRGGSFSGSRGNFSSSNRYGGSTSHSYGSTSHSNAYGGSSSHTAGQGTTHNSAYGTSTSHNEGGGTTHTNAYGGKTSGEYGEGATHTNTYGGTTSGEYGEGATHTNTYGGTTSAAYGQGATHTNVMVGPLRPRMAKVRTTPAPMVTALRIIRQPRIMATSACHGQLLRINMRQLQRVGGCCRCHNRRCYGAAVASANANAANANAAARQPTLTTLDTTPAQPRVNLPRPRQPWLRHQAAIPWDRWLRRSRQVALHPPSKGRPTTCVATPGSVRPTAQTAFTIAWCLVPAASSLFDRWSTLFEQEATEETEGFLLSISVLSVCSS